MIQSRRGGARQVALLVVGVVLATVAVGLAVWYPRHNVKKNVALVRSEMRALATAIESYAVDHMIYPAWGIGHPGPGNVRSFNDLVARKTGNRSGVADLPAFLLNDRSDPGGQFDMLTTASAFSGWIEDSSVQGGYQVERKWLSYIPRYPVDPFCKDRGPTYVFWSLFPGGPHPSETPVGGVGWMLVSPGPDGDYDLAGHYHVYDPSKPQPSPWLLAGTNSKGSAFTYDPTNGLYSDGDIWRVKQ